MSPYCKFYEQQHLILCHTLVIDECFFAKNLDTRLHLK